MIFMKDLISFLSSDINIFVSYWEKKMVGRKCEMDFGYLICKSSKRNGFFGQEEGPLEKIYKKKG